MNKTYKENWENVKNLTGDYLVPFWQNINQKIGNQFAANLPENFLATPEIINTMYSSNVGEATKQLKELEQYYDEKTLKCNLVEDDAGCPAIINQKYVASCNTIHHMYHLYKCFKKSPVHKRNIAVEWGGGYGRFALTASRFLDARTYIIIDIPAFSCLQYHYLSSVGKDVFLHTGKNKTIVHGKFNLIPVGLLDIGDFGLHLDIVDYFIAMWSLSESNKKSVDYVINNNFFNARNIMMAFHANEDGMLPMGHALYKECQERKLNIERAEIAQNHYYAFT